MVKRWGTNAWFSMTLAALAFAFSYDVLTRAVEAGTVGPVEDVYLEDVIGALERMEQEVGDLSHLAEVRTERVRVVVVDELVNGNDESSQILEEAMMVSESKIAALRDVVGERAELLMALHEQALMLRQVVALDVRSEGTVLVFCK
jgi:hypothetical protein